MNGRLYLDLVVRSRRAPARALVPSSHPNRLVLLNLGSHGQPAELGTKLECEALLGFGIDAVSIRTIHGAAAVVGDVPTEIGPEILENHSGG